MVCLAILLGDDVVAAASQPAPNHTITYQQPKPPEPAESASANERDTKQLPLVVEVKAMPERTQEERADQAAERHDKADTDRWLVRLTAILAVATALLVIATGFLWNATKQLVGGAEDTAKRQLRAYVFVGEAEIIHAGTNMVEAAIKIKNFGQTPAYDVTISTAAQAFNIPGDIAFAPTPVGPDSSRFVFGPGAEGRHSIPLHTLIGEPEAMSGLKAGEGALYVYGEIRYRDTFRRQVGTRFRFVIGGTVGWPSDNRMVVCQEGNEEDYT